MTLPTPTPQQIVDAWQESMRNLRTRAVRAGKPHLVPIVNYEPSRPPVEFSAFRAGYNAGYLAAQKREVS